MTPGGRMAKSKARQDEVRRSGAIEGGGGAVDDKTAVFPDGATVVQPARGGLGGERQGRELVWDATLWDGGSGGDGSGIAANRRPETAN